MEKVAPRFTLAAVAEMLGGVPDGPPGLPLSRPVPAGQSDPLGVTFAENEKYLSEAEQTDVGAVIVSKESRPATRPLIRVDNPRFAFARFLAICQKQLPLNEGVHPTAVVDPAAQVASDARIGPYVCIERGAVIKSGAKIYPFCYVGENCHVGANSILYPHVVLYQDVHVGEGSIIHAGAVIGADGFGFVWDGRRRVKVPQVGGVELGREVEVGANTTVDRATAGVTKVGTGTKLDNLVQIAHNVEIGEHAVVAGLSGVSGSAKVGDRAVLGGGVGIGDHVTVASDVLLAGRSSVGSDIPEPGGYIGTPAMPHMEGKRAILLTTKLPEMLSRIRALEKELKELKEKQS